MKKDNQIYDIYRAKKECFDWGTISWLDDSEISEQSGMLIAHVTFLPNKVQGKHLHTGDEQVIYTVSGEGEHWLNGKRYPLEPGKVYHIQTFVEHDIVNTGDTLLEMIIVYTINYKQIDSLIPKIDFIENYTEKKLTDLVDLNILDKIIKSLSDVIDFPIVVQDNHGKVLTKSSKIPKFCEMYFRNNKCCHLTTEGITSEIPHDDDIQECCLDLVKLSAPIYFNYRLIGKITCGPVIINEYSNDIIEKLKNDKKNQYGELVNEYLKIDRVTNGHLRTNKELLKRISSFIVDMGSKNVVNKEFKDKSYEILKEKNARIKLEKTLVETKMKVIQAQMSPHFLFNTLSVIGQLAYMNGAKEAADTTFALSSLLRKNLTSANEFVTIAEEIKYIEDYVFIQNKRFDNSLILIIDMSKEVKDFPIPFLMLQILIENAIVHGFGTLKGTGRLKIEGYIEAEHIHLYINDNGVGIKDSAIENINNRYKDIKNSDDIGIGLGIKSICQRLEYYYEKKFDFSIHKKKSGGTEVKIKLPLIRIGGNNRI